MLEHIKLKYVRRLVSKAHNYSRQLLSLALISPIVGYWWNDGAMIPIDSIFGLREGRVFEQCEQDKGDGKVYMRHGVG